MILDQWLSIWMIFFKMLKTHSVKITIFILGELIDRHKDLIQSFVNEGHEIAIHGWDHQLLGEKSNEVFKSQILQTKENLERLFGCEVIGYRALCFSMSNGKFKILESIELKYGSSFIISY